MNIFKFFLNMVGTLENIHFCIFIEKHFYGTSIRNGLD